jgi:fused signal recognition particle receptor
MGVFDFFKKKPKAAEAEDEEKAAIDQGLEKTKTSFFSKLSKAVVGRSTVDVDFLDELEEILVSADVGIETTVKIIERLEARVARDKYLNANELNEILKEEVNALLAESKQQQYDSLDWQSTTKPYVIMVVGVNGVGKTTTIGKLAYQFRQQGLQVRIGAADTFRAAAVDQLAVWADRAEVPLVSRGMNADPAAVAFDTVQSAQAQGDDIVLVDTAGRLHNKKPLMEELAKIKRVMQKITPEAPHEVMLVLDASTGQNAVQQASEFIKVTDISSIALTKLDGTAKGGVVLSIIDQFNVPVKYIGVGERIEDLRVFNREAFVASLFNL